MRRTRWAAGSPDAQCNSDPFAPSSGEVSSFGRIGAVSEARKCVGGAPARHPARDIRTPARCRRTRRRVRDRPRARSLRCTTAGPPLSLGGLPPHVSLRRGHGHHPRLDPLLLPADRRGAGVRRLVAEAALPAERLAGGPGVRDPEPALGRVHPALLHRDLRVGRRARGGAAMGARRSRVAGAGAVRRFRRVPRLRRGRGGAGGVDGGVPAGGPGVLLEPPALPRDQPAVGGARGAPQQRGVQPGGRAAAELAARPVHVGVLPSAGADGDPVAGVRGLLLAEPALPVLDPHARGRAAGGGGGVGAEHPLAPPRAPRPQPEVPGPQPRRRADRVGPPLRHLPARGGGAGVRDHEAAAELEPAVGERARLRRPCPRRAAGGRVARPVDAGVRPAGVAPHRPVGPRRRRR